VTFAERVDEVRGLERGGGLPGRVVLVQERAAREEADRLRDGGLEEAAELRMCRAVGGQDLTEGEERRNASSNC
jgi:hypothetical protein